ncbi:hypothetical protein K5D65_02285 [Pseudomonas cichorii]|nr:hypothetical protein [Pseudomonas cichorii]
MRGQPKPPEGLPDSDSATTYCIENDKYQYDIPLYKKLASNIISIFSQFSLDSSMKRPLFLQHHLTFDKCPKTGHRALTGRQGRSVAAQKIFNIF